VSSSFCGHADTKDCLGYDFLKISKCLHSVTSHRSLIFAFSCKLFSVESASCREIDSPPYYVPEVIPRKSLRYQADRIAWMGSERSQVLTFLINM
jgi:hypothetical protein